MQLMRGYWILAKRAPDTSAVVVSLVLEASGRITLEEDYKNEDGGQLRVILKGKWWVKDGVAYGDFTETSHPDIAPLYKTRDTILHLDDRAMELRTKDGEFERWERNVG